MSELKCCACGCGTPVARTFARGHNRTGCFPSVDVRLDARIDRSGGPDACWPWRGQVTDYGYGRMAVRGRLLMAHRLVYERAYGPLPAGAWVWHQCENPGCCNPGHLEVAAPGDLSLGDRSRGEAHHRARLTEGAVREIRLRHAAGERAAALSRTFGVSRTAVSDIVLRRRWRHIA